MYAVSIHVFGSSPMSAAKLPARAGLSLPIRLAFVMVLGVIFRSRAHADGPFISSARRNSSAVFCMRPPVMC